VLQRESQPILVTVVLYDSVINDGIGVIAVVKIGAARNQIKSFNCIPAPLLYAWKSQVAEVVPFEMPEG
jgi:hypothetical protein